MAIKFYCSCGKHLRAREAMAGRRSQCPACGQPVGIPSLQPTHAGTVAAPLTLEERRRRGGPGVAELPQTAATTDEAADPPDAGRDRRRSRSRRAKALEQHWYQCLLFPGYAWHLLVPLGLVLTGISGVAVLAVPEVGDIAEVPWYVWAVCWAAPFLVVGYTCAHLGSVLVSAAAGEIGVTPWPGADVGRIARSLVFWLVAFLAGPLLFGAAAFLFWLHAGDPKPIDWLIIGELVLAGAAHWLLALTALHQTDRLRDANPLRVAGLIRRMGYGIVFASAGLAFVALALGSLVLYGLATLHEDPVAGWSCLAGGWLLLLAWLAFAFRLLGLWCFRSRVDAA